MKAMDFTISHVTVNPITYDLDKRELSGAKLILRRFPDDLGETLGWIVNTSGLPRWMSSEFSSAHEEHVRAVPGADLNLYSNDWFERIVFIPTEGITTDAAKAQIADWSQKTANFMNALDHPLSTGCQTVAPRTRVQQIVFDPPDKATLAGIEPYQNSDFSPQDIFYAVVSKHDDSILARAVEITIAPLTSRPEFVQSKMHCEALANSYRLRHKQVSTTNISQLRQEACNAVKAFQGAP